MKSLLFFGIATLIAPHHSSFAYDCENQPYQSVVKVGQISPTKARAILKNSDFSIAPELLTVTSNQDSLKQALSLGMKIQQAGNDGLIRNIDALVYIIEGRYASNRYQQGAYDLALPILNGTSTLDYYDGNQYSTGIVELATLRLMGRSDEANQLQAFLGGTSFTGAKINELSLLLNYNGRFTSKNASINFCNKVKAL